MGGVASTIGGAVGDVLTLGTSHIPGSPTKYLAKGIGAVFSGGLSLGGDSGGNSPAQAAGKQSPLDILTSSGGAPLLMDIALGVAPEQALMTYFGASGDYNNWFNSLDKASQDAISGLHDTLTSVQTNTNTQNQTVKQLVNDYPNIMATKIQQYQTIADPAIQKMMGQAMNELSAKQAAGGMLSSGASIEAAAQVGAQYAGKELDYATGMANQDFMQQLNNAQGLQSFQQKMLGQGAMNGFNAVQNALNRNANVNMQNANFQNQANIAEQNKQAGLFGALGGVAGTVLGGYFGGPMGAMAGGKVGNSVGQYVGGSGNNTPGASGDFGNA